jgi:hypothetical protein
VAEGAGETTPVFPVVVFVLEGNAVCTQLTGKNILATRPATKLNKKP